MARKMRPYQTCPGQQRGNPEIWRKMGEALLASLGGKEDADLELLGLTSMPDAEGLKKAYRKAMLASHPDRQGGDHAVAAKVTAAYSRLNASLPSPKASPTPKAANGSILVLARCTAEIPDQFETGYVAELKIDGCRYGLYLGQDPYGRGHSSTLLSQHESKVHKGQYVDKTTHMPRLTSFDTGPLKDTLLDGEVFLKSHTLTQKILSSSPAEAAALQAEHGSLVFYVIDVPFYKGQDVRSLPYHERRSLVQSVVAEMANPLCQAIPQRTSKLQAYFDEVVAAGGEGIVLKPLNSTYGQGWAKLKKSYDVSVIISGFQPGKKGFEGMVGSLLLSVYKDGKLTEIGKASGFDVALRTQLTNNFAAYKGKVIDVYAQEITSGGRLRHATFRGRFRDDIDPLTCTAEKMAADLKTKAKSTRKNQ